VKLLALISVLLVGCSSTNKDLTPGHQFYTEFGWSLSEDCSDERASVRISARNFSVGNTICEIENFEDKHWKEISLKKCVSDGSHVSNKTVTISTTYNATFIEDWTENPQKLYRCVS